MANYDVQVMGASAGGFGPLRRVLLSLPEGMPTSIFIVVHVSPDSPGLLASILQSSCKLPVVFATDKSRIERGMIYVAPADRHLLLERSQMRVLHGPRENRHRPSVDVLFRSAAWA